MEQSPSRPESPEALRDFEHVLKQLLRLPPPKTKAVRARQTARLVRAKKARRPVSSSA